MMGQWKCIDSIRYKDTKKYELVVSVPERPTMDELSVMVEELISRGDYPGSTGISYLWDGKNIVFKTVSEGE